MVKGRGIFPRFALDLPRVIPDRPDLLEDLLAQAEKDLGASQTDNAKLSATLDAGLIRLKTFLTDQKSFDLSAMGVGENVQSLDFISDEHLASVICCTL